MTISDHHEQLTQAVEAIASADALLIGAGAGMGVDSGLPDFRGDGGFWRAYPPFHGKSFASISNPVWFHRDPQQAWGFFGHRLNLYRGTQPHAGFEILRRMAESRPAGYFVFTSNVDGHFQKAGFAPTRIFECHGSIDYLQCVNCCTSQIWSACETRIDVDPATIRATSALPRCPDCRELARPNILMFGDYEWQPQRSGEQESLYHRWLASITGQRLVAIEFGAGLAIPTVRRECETRGMPLIRVNPREAETAPGGISLPYGALDALRRLEAGGKRQ